MGPVVGIEALAMTLDTLTIPRRTRREWPPRAETVSRRELRYFLLLIGSALCSHRLTSPLFARYISTRHIASFILRNGS